MRLISAAWVLLLTASAASARDPVKPPLSPSSTLPAPVAQPRPQPPAPPYLVAQGQHTEDAAPYQKLTVLCPANHKAFGAGFSALVRDPPRAGQTAATFHESGLDGVRSFPDTAGTGWQVEGTASDAARLKQPWRLVVRVVCVQIGG